MRNLKYLSKNLKNLSNLNLSRIRIYNYWIYEIYEIYSIYFKSLESRYYWILLFYLSLSFSLLYCLSLFSSFLFLYLCRLFLISCSSLSFSPVLPFSRSLSNLSRFLFAFFALGLGRWADPIPRSDERLHLVILKGWAWLYNGRNRGEASLSLSLASLLSQ